MKIYQYNIDGEQFFVAADTQDQSDFAIMEDGLCDPEELNAPEIIPESEWDNHVIYDEAHDKEVGTMRDIIKDVELPSVIACTIE